MAALPGIGWCPAPRCPWPSAAPRSLGRSGVRSYQHWSSWSQPRAWHLRRCCAVAGTPRRGARSRRNYRSDTPTDRTNGSEAAGHQPRADAMTGRTTAATNNNAKSELGVRGMPLTDMRMALAPWWTLRCGGGLNQPAWHVAASISQGSTRLLGVPLRTYPLMR